jgi:hypothetical protein
VSARRPTISKVADTGYRVASEASGFLVGPTVFKTDEPVDSRLAGSIPVRLR